ncbi:MAG: hypothetical protein JWP75_114 [Frondihabitans sp.]|nr:hypothetical protein [Frondihabitans sp.]
MTFVSRFNRILSVVIWALCAFVVVATFIGSPAEGVVALAPGIVIALVDWIVLWRPRVEVTGDGVTLLNVLRRVTIPWAALINVDTKYALTLHTPGHKYAAWAAPAPGRAGAAVARRQARSGNVAPRAAVAGKAAPGDLLTTDSGAAADMVLERWEELRESGALTIGEADSTRVTSVWLWQPAVVAVAIAAISVVVVRLN